MPENKLFSRGPHGEFQISGWALFGHILPRIHFEMFPCSWDGEPALDDDPGGYQREALVLEWFGVGTCIAFGKPEVAQ